MTNKSIIGTRNCFGCGVCAVACAKNIINIRLNRNGFLEPIITDVNKCTNCGLCSSVCSYKEDKPANCKSPIKFFASWSKDHGVRLSSSSGGVAYELGRSALALGYKVCGVRYDVENHRAIHFIAENLEDLSLSLGSKYLQSETVFAFNRFDKQQKYLVFGTPCQIDSLRRYIQKFKIEDNFILVDFFCHGVPSKLSWTKYLESNRKLGKIEHVSFRNKFKGLHIYNPLASEKTNSTGERIPWHESYNIFLKGEKGSSNSGFRERNSFLRMFLRDFSLNPACFDKCMYKQLSSSADIRLGDFWGDCYAQDEDGVSSVIVYTEKGRLLFENSMVEKNESSSDEVLSVQMKSRPIRPHNYSKVMKCLTRKTSNIKFIDTRYILITDISNKIKTIIKKYVK